MIDVGTRVDDELLENYFIVPEGEGNIYIGKIRQGKSYGATRDIWHDLNCGRTVYATWPIRTEHIDDRESFFFLLRGLILPWKKRFFVIPTTENFHYINADTGEVDGIKTFEPTTKGYVRYLNSLNHCTLYIDEAWRILNHVLVAKPEMENVFNLILVTGHKFRTVNVIAQRLVGINPTFRDNANRVFRFTKMSFLGITRFKREEFQDWSGDQILPDTKPDSIQTYWGNKKIFASYNSWYYGELDPLHELKFSAYDLTYFERIKALGIRIFSSLSFIVNFAFFFIKKLRSGGRNSEN